MQNVFETLPATEQQEAKDYMQARIENLHRAADKDTQWFDFPGGGTLPKEKVSIDESLLVTPPAGMEYGYVPIALYERKKARPVDCEVRICESLQVSCKGGSLTIFALVAGHRRCI